MKYLHLNLLKSKLNRAIGLLCKIRHYVSKFLLKTLYYTTFHSHLIYAYQVWAQSLNTSTKMQPLEPRYQRPLQKWSNTQNFRLHYFTAWKVFKYGVFSGPYFPVFGLNTGKYGPEKSRYLDTFHAVFVRDVATNKVDDSSFPKLFY